MSVGKRNHIKSAVIGLALVALAGCTAQYRNHGYAPSEEDLAAIAVGVDTRDTVREVVGAPSTDGLLSGGDYYYVRSRVRHFAYKRPEVIKRELLAISFDDTGVVQNIERFGLEDGRAVPLSRRVTDSSVTNKSFFRQLLGAIGQIGPSGLGGGPG